jgi:Uma2 family endonuclease
LSGCRGEIQAAAVEVDGVDEVLFVAEAAAAFLVEVLSESDVMSVVIEKLKEYAGKGVRNIWLIDPRLQLMCMYCPPTLIEIEGEVLATADRSIELSRAEIFAD